LTHETSRKLVDGGAGTPSPLSILIVEDDEVDRLAIRRTLKKYQGAIRFREAGGASEARRALAAESFDCALLDQRLPDGEGMDLIREILSASRQRTAIVILTGVDDEARALRALSEGADDYLVKGQIDDYALLRSVRYATERRRSESLRAQIWHMDRMAALGRLAAGVAHEINNPLTCIIGNLDTVERRPEELARALDAGPAGRTKVAELATLLDECLIAAEQAAAIVRDLRTLSRADDRPLAPVSLAEALDSAVNMSAIQIRHRAKLVKAYGDTAPVLANAQRLIQVFVNLLINAAQAIPEGSPAKNEIRIVTRTDGGGRAVIEISDTGAGILPEDRARIFEPFFTTKRIGEGSGLGLSICWGIVSSLGGDITFEPRTERGTTFRVTLPPASSQRDATEAGSEPRASASPARRKRVLVIDDDPLVLKTWHSVLGRQFDVVAFSDAREALDRVVSGEPFDAILTDVTMPGMGGREFYRALKKACPGEESKVLLVTGGSVFTDDEIFLEKMPGRWLHKPVLPRVLRDRLEWIASGRPTG